MTQLKCTYKYSHPTYMGMLYSSHKISSYSTHNFALGGGVSEIIFTILIRVYTAIWSHEERGGWATELFNEKKTA